MITRPRTWSDDDKEVLFQLAKTEMSARDLVKLCNQGVATKRSASSIRQRFMEKPRSDPHNYREKLRTLIEDEEYVLLSKQLLAGRDLPRTDPDVVPSALVALVFGYGLYTVRGQVANGGLVHASSTRACQMVSFTAYARSLPAGSGRRGLVAGMLAGAKLPIPPTSQWLASGALVQRLLSLLTGWGIRDSQYAPAAPRRAARVALGKTTMPRAVVAAPPSTPPTTPSPPVTSPRVVVADATSAPTVAVSHTLWQTLKGLTNLATRDGLEPAAAIKAIAAVITKVEASQ